MCVYDNKILALATHKSAAQRVTTLKGSLGKRSKSNLILRYLVIRVGDQARSTNKQGVVGATSSEPHSSVGACKQKQHAKMAQSMQIAQRLSSHTCPHAHLSSKKSMCVLRNRNRSHKAAAGRQANQQCCCSMAESRTEVSEGS